ncbi:hypothetical protein [Sedimenticola selenatireducens]|nr:hypothetical protein [Sedimenticola selenatireducens]
MNDQVNGLELFSIFSDSASAEYLWGALLDALGEFDGGGISAGVLG